MNSKKYAHIILGNDHYLVEVANTPKEREKGLSKRVSLPPNTGMLFNLPKEDIWPFQMRETYIPLDILFLSKKGQIVDYIKNAAPLSDKVYKPKEKCKMVLEIPGNSFSHLTDQVSDAKVRYFDSLESAKGYIDKFELAELLIKHLNEEINDKKIRRK